MEDGLGSGIRDPGVGRRVREVCAVDGISCAPAGLGLLRRVVPIKEHFPVGPVPSTRVRPGTVRCSLGHGSPASPSICGAHRCMPSSPGAPAMRTRGWRARIKRSMQAAARPSAFVRLPHGGIPGRTAPCGDIAYVRFESGSLLPARSSRFESRQLESRARSPQLCVIVDGGVSRGTPLLSS